MSLRRLCRNTWQASGLPTNPSEPPRKTSPGRLSCLHVYIKHYHGARICQPVHRLITQAMYSLIMTSTFGSGVASPLATRLMSMIALGKIW